MNKDLSYLKSSDYDWHLDGNERAVDNLQLYDVTKAKEILKTYPREAVVIDLVEHGPALLNFLADVTIKENVDWSKVDCSLPVIFVSNPEGKIPIDGRHRLRKALDCKHKTILAFFLTPEESDTVKMIHD